jgi:hypothetical protein
VSQGTRILAVAVVAVLAGGGAALVLADGKSESRVPTTGPFTQTTDPSGEDFWDQIEHEVPINRIADAAEDAFGPRFGGIAIDRGVEPNVLRVYVADATLRDEVVLARIGDDHPQVVLQPADFTWGQLLVAKEAVADVAIDQDLGEEVRSFGIEPDLVDQRVSVTSTQQLSRELEASMRRAAGDVPVAFAFGPEYRYELLAAP